MAYSIHAQMLKKYVCDICEEEDQFVDWFCSNCTQNFCERCKTLHLKAKLCRNHVMIPIADAVHVQRDQDGLCSEHGEPFTFHCRSCDKAACAICLTTSHKRHDFCRMSEEIELKKALFESCLMSKEAELENLRKKMSKLDQSREKYEKDCDKFERNIDQRIKDLQKKLTEVGAEIKKEVKTSAGSFSDKIEEVRNEVREHDKQLTIWRGELNARQEGALLRFVTENQENVSSYSLVVSEVAPPSVPVLAPDVDPETLKSLLWSYPNDAGMTSEFNSITVLPIKRSQVIYDISVTPDGHAWLVTADGFLLLIDQRGKELDRYYKLKVPYHQHRICTLKSGDLLISCGKVIRRLKIAKGTGNESVFASCPFGTVFSTIRQCPISNKVFALVTQKNSNSLHAYLEDGQSVFTFDVNSDRVFGRFIEFTLNFDGDLCALFEGGVVVRNGSSRTFRTLEFPRDLGGFRKIRADSQGNIVLIRERSKSVYIFNRKDQMRTYTLSPLTESDAASEPLWDIDLDSQKRLWITTNCGQVIIAKYLP